MKSIPYLKTGSTQATLISKEKKLTMESYFFIELLSLGQSFQFDFATPTWNFHYIKPHSKHGQLTYNK